MASAQFPPPGPGTDPSDDFEPAVPGGPDAAAYEAGMADDPGYLASMRPPETVLGQLRVMVTALVTAPVLMLAISPLIVPAGEGRLGDLAPWLCLPILAVAAAALLLGPRAPRPLVPSQDREWAVRQSVLLFRQAVMFRYALSEATILVGLPLAMVGRSVWVFVFAFVVGYPILFWLTVPTATRVEAIRRRLETAGEPSYLWTALLKPVNRP
ncbi:hypothetical protein [Actinomadura rupiterrae]|uniref:hypothetical protein n=1 Tax=Actinomadura rupiterrae TaxID=559627 RepID=UPI0020A3DF3E|nr:hypothetical protein [Actinomadura rupiterrae]MCP2341485.1 hypothetical protein [Actinomadura rupiterrae]